MIVMLRCSLSYAKVEIFFVYWEIFFVYDENSLDFMPSGMASDSFGNRIN